MNRRFALIWGLATVAIASVVGAIAYHAGQTATVVTTAPGSGEVVYRGYDGFGFFPLFGLFWLLLFGFFFFRLLFWRSWGRGPWGWGGGYPRSGGLKDWHQQEHSGTTTTPTTTPAPQPDDRASA